MMLGTIQPQHSQTVRQEVYRLLRERLLTGDVAPGTKLAESVLAKAINASRTPVREALHSLEKEGLIKSVPRVGYVVKEITQGEVEEIILIRMALETLAAKWASERISTRDLGRLESIISLTEKSIAKKQTRRVAELDTEFHDIICRASRSSRIVEISQTLRDHMLRFRLRALGVSEFSERANEGHKKILNAIKSRKAREIESAVRFHLDWTRKDVFTAFQRPL